jgi:hypothetical protein
MHSIARDQIINTASLEMSKKTLSTTTYSNEIDGTVHSQATMAVSDQSKPVGCMIGSLPIRASTDADREFIFNDICTDLHVK